MQLNHGADQTRCERLALAVEVRLGYLKALLLLTPMNQASELEITWLVGTSIIVEAHPTGHRGVETQ